MNLQQLEALAHSCLNEPAPYVRAEAQRQLFDCNMPKTIKRLIALCRMQHEVLVDERYVSRYSHVVEAIAAFDAFERNE